MKLDAKNNPAIRDFEKWVKDEINGINAQPSTEPSTEQPASAAGSELWPFCAKDEHQHCAGEAQLTRKGPPSRCGCACHEHELPAPAAQETGERGPLVSQYRQLVAEREYAALIAERERLRAALQRIADYPSGYKFSGVVSDGNPVGRDREDMIHIARTALRKQDQIRREPRTTTERG